jgi:hypothetical protein
MPMNFLVIASLLVILVVVLLCLAYPIQTLVIKVRNYAFLKMNRKVFKQVYKNPCAHMRSRGAGLADLFWYFLSPGPHMHQETMDEGSLYDNISVLTRQILAKPADAFRNLITKHTQHYVDQQATQSQELIRLRDLMIPIWANFFYELLFDEAPNKEELQLIVANATEFIQTVKCVKLRNMKPRYAVVELMKKKIMEGKFSKSFPLDLSLDDKAFYLRGIYLTSAITQLSEAVSHVLLCLAEHPDYQEKILTGDEDILDKVVMETLRLYPLFGISLRILTGDVTVDEQTVLKKGTAICFHHPSFHRMGYQDANEFKPERWDTQTRRDANYIPFGVVGNHSCPAQGLATIAIPACVKIMVKHFTFKIATKHTRSQVLRGPCLMVRRGHSCTQEKALLTLLSLRNRMETLTTSIKQLVIETITFIHAKRLGLAKHYFEARKAKSD